MKILLPWLTDFLDVDLSDIEDIAERLTFAGLEVEATELFGDKLEGIIVGSVESSRPHPDSDHLSVCDVYDGEKIRNVICGAPNVRTGMRAPYIPPGHSLPSGLEVTERKVRGINSSGMLLSASELGLWDDHSGILDLGNAVPGKSIKEELGLPVPVLDISVTPNRPDALSHAGVAREIAALLGCEFRLPETGIEITDESCEAASRKADIRIEDPDLCSRYAADIIEGVRIGPSPLQMRIRLAAAGIRPINNVVDVTNYVLLELGHPLHAFDLDLVKNSTIIVRRAKQEEILVTLDGVTRKLSDEDLVIADDRNPVALAGVMGGGDSEVSESTSRILLESAWFQPVTVRRTARRHGLNTESSFRFERGADPKIPAYAARRATSLIIQTAGGTFEGELDIHPVPALPEPVTLCFDRTSSVLGYSVSAKRQVEILRNLGFDIREINDSHAVVLPPTFRTEMSREIDLIEEVARIQGYDAIPATLPARDPEPSVSYGLTDSRIINYIRQAAASAGCFEVVNYSFISEEEIIAVEAPDSTVEEAKKAGLNILKLTNPLTAEQSCMRTRVISSLLSNLRHNRRFRSNDVKLYEIGRRYGTDGGMIVEKEVFSALMSGRRHISSWTSPDDHVDFYDVKGLAEAIFQKLGMDSGSSFIYSPESFPWLHPGSACSINTPDGRMIGWMGEIHPFTAKRLDLPGKIMAVELDIEILGNNSVIVPEYRKVPKYPALLRDLAVVVDENIPAGKVRELLVAPLPEASSIGVTVADAVLFDVYTGPQAGEAKRSLAYAIRYQAGDRTLTDVETNKIHEALLQRLEKNLGASLRT